MPRHDMGSIMGVRSVIVIGAGLGGLCAAILLRAAGHQVVVLDKAARVGGTWRDNTYPGCACDTEVAVYQFSFAPWLEWSHFYPRQPEILAYAEHLVASFGLAPALRLGDEAIHARWDDSTARWTVTTRAGAHHEADVLVPALGQLSRPQLPAIEGRESFVGPAFHSARWDHGVDLAGRRVGVIGAAASAVQLIPEVAEAAGHLAVFQRTPNWIVPRLDYPISDQHKALVRSAPQVATLEREFIYQKAEQWLWQAFEWTAEGRAAYTRFALDHLHAQVPDPVLRARLTPDYPIGCKRILVADTYYPALMRPNVTLVTDAIQRISPKGVVTADGVAHALDVLVYATGFETTGWHWSLDVAGRGGLTLAEAWHDVPQAYLGLAVAGFPNMFMIYGPNTNLGHNSITFMIERQAEYAVKAMAAMDGQDAVALEVTTEAMARFNAALQTALARSTWADLGCNSWYKTADGRIVQNWSSHTRAYAEATRHVDLGDFTFHRRGRIAA